MTTRWVTAALLAGTVAVTSASDWPEWRGPSRDGRSPETGLPASWSPKGENLAWRVPIGSRSSPVVFRNRVYLLQPFGDPATTQERLVATRRRFRQGGLGSPLQHLPERRAAASRRVGVAVGRSETGNIYVMTVGAELVCVSPDGKTLWDGRFPKSTVR